MFNKNSFSEEIKKIYNYLGKTINLSVTNYQLKLF